MKKRLVRSCESIPESRFVKESCWAWLAADWSWRLGEARAVELCPPFTRSGGSFSCSIHSCFLLFLRANFEDWLRAYSECKHLCRGVHKRHVKESSEEMFGRVDSRVGFSFAGKVNVEPQRVVSVGSRDYGIQRTWSLYYLLSSGLACVLRNDDGVHFVIGLWNWCHVAFNPLEQYGTALPAS